MKNLMNLGKILNKKEQKSIHGGANSCSTDKTICMNGCYQGFYGSWGSIVGAAGCVAMCEGVRVFCELNEGLPAN